MRHVLSGMIATTLVMGGVGLLAAYVPARQATARARAAGSTRPGPYPTDRKHVGYIAISHEIGPRLSK